MDFRIEMDFDTRTLIKLIKSELRILIICMRVIALVLVLLYAGTIIFHTLDGGTVADEWKNFLISIVTALIWIMFPQIGAGIRRVKRKVTGRYGKCEIYFHEDSMDIVYLYSNKCEHFSHQEIGVIEKKKYFYKIRVGRMKSIFIEREKLDDESYVMLEKWINKI